MEQDPEANFTIMMWLIVLILAMLLMPLFVPICHTSLLNLRKSVHHVQLPFSPTDLSILDVAILVCLFVIRTVKHTLGFGHDFPRRQAKSKQRTSRAHPKNAATTATGSGVALQLPDLSLSMPLHIKSRDVAQYIFSATNIRNVNPTTNPVQAQLHPDSSIITSNPAHLSLFLSAVSEPALLLLLARKGCPIRPLGGVNVRNRFELLDFDLCSQAVTDANKLRYTGHADKDKASTNGDNSLGALSVLASLPKQATRVKRGVEIDITVSIILTPPGPSGPTNGIATIEIFRQVFTILSFLPTSTLPRPPPDPELRTTSAQSKANRAINAARPRTLQPVPPAILAVPPTLAIYMKISSSSPSSWARLCKDYNPIHISGLLARMYGFRGRVAHGNHVVARASHVIPFPGELLVEMKNAEEQRRAMWMEVRFKRPVVVPIEVGVRMLEDEQHHKRKHDVQTWRVEVFKGDKVLVEIDAGLNDYSSRRL